MIALIEENRDAIITLCEQYGVERLSVFGSAARGTFNPATSDLDFVLEFTDYGPGVSARFINFADGLETLFGRRVDLVFETKLNNTAFRTEVLSTMERIFDAEERRHAAA